MSGAKEQNGFSNVDDQDLPDAQIISHLYGIAKRKEDFQDLYSAFSAYVVDCEDSNREKDFRQSFENYFGPIESSTDREEIYSGLSNTKFSLTEDDFQEYVEDIKTNL